MGATSLPARELPHKLPSQAQPMGKRRSACVEGCRAPPSANRARSVQGRDGRCEGGGVE